MRTTILDPGRLPSILVLVRTNMFPNNSLGPGRVPPTPQEAVEIRKRCAAAIASIIPALAQNVVFKTADAEVQRAEIEDMLMVFGDAYLNKHLIVSIVDLVVLRLFPEMREENVESFLKEDSLEES